AIDVDLGRRRISLDLEVDRPTRVDADVAREPLNRGIARARDDPVGGACLTVFGDDRVCRTRAAALRQDGNAFRATARQHERGRHRDKQSNVLPAGSLPDRCDSHSDSVPQAASLAVARPPNTDIRTTEKAIRTSRFATVRIRGVLIYC